MKSQGISTHLRPRPDALDWAARALARLPRPLLHAHVTSRDMQKAIPVKVVREVFQGVLAAGGSVVITTGSAEVETSHAAACVEGLPRERIRTFGDLTWHELVALIARCAKYWGSDTAPAHIASSLEKPMLVHYGPSNAAHWRALHAYGRADVRTCACLADKRSVCPKDRPGVCLEDVDPAEVLAWWQSSLSI